MMLQFFWTRSASIWIALLYMLLGIPMLFFPSLTGSLFVWALAGGMAAYGITHSSHLFITIYPTLGYTNSIVITGGGENEQQGGCGSANSKSLCRTRNHSNRPGQLLCNAPNYNL